MTAMSGSARISNEDGPVISLHQLLLLSALTALLPVQAQAEPALSGSDAATIDWAVKNCGVSSTDKEHRLIDTAKSKGAAAFDRDYLKQFQTKALADAAETPGRTRSMCDDITNWYGPAGNKLAGLITAGASSIAASTDGPAKPTDAKSGKKGRRKNAQ
jgi:hypothetical protein